MRHPRRDAFLWCANRNKSARPEIFVKTFNRHLPRYDAAHRKTDQNHVVPAGVLRFEYSNDVARALVEAVPLRRIIGHPKMPIVRFWPRAQRFFQLPQKPIRRIPAVQNDTMFLLHIEYSMSRCASWFIVNDRGFALVEKQW